MLGAGPVAQRLSSHVPLLGGPGFAGSDPGCRHSTAWQPCCGRRPTYKTRGRWAQMLAQSQASLAKTGGLTADVSSGLIVLKKKKERKKERKKIKSLNDI